MESSGIARVIFGIVQMSNGLSRVVGAPAVLLAMDKHRAEVSEGVAQGDGIFSVAKSIERSQIGPGGAIPFAQLAVEMAQGTLSFARFEQGGYRP